MQCMARCVITATNTPTAPACEAAQRGAAARCGGAAVGEGVGEVWGV